jgi:CRISPR system Cascade subunit CasE
MGAVQVVERGGGGVNQHLIEMELADHGLKTFCDLSGLPKVPDDSGLQSDLGYEIHAWLGETFGSMAPKPWRLGAYVDGWLYLQGYSPYSSNELLRPIQQIGEPFGIGVVGSIASTECLGWHPGQRLGFDVLCCPVGRRSRARLEKDLYLLRLDHAEADEALNREDVYRAWVRERLERTSAAAVDWIRLASFRQVRQLRKTQGEPGARQCRWIERPSALLGGQLTVRDTDAFQALLAHGIGRHRAFGYGMIRVWPADGGDKS